MSIYFPVCVMSVGNILLAAKMKISLPNSVKPLEVLAPGFVLKRLDGIRTKNKNTSAFKSKQKRKLNSAKTESFTLITIMLTWT